MYNLFVTSDVGKWDASYFTYEISRVFEYTADSISVQYRKFDASSIDALLSFPALFAYEKFHSIDARIGWINHIKLLPGFVKIEHEFDSTVPLLPASSLLELSSRLDIQTGEMNRTHWAVKNKNLWDVLFEAGLIKQKKPQGFRAFLCHASDDKAKVEVVYKQLTSAGVDTWFDKKSLLPGQDWEYEIRKAVREADAVVICLSKQFNKAGYRQKEVRFALDVAMEQPEEEIFIIPARLEECDTLESLRKWHWVDLFEDNGYERLLMALQRRANSLGIRIAKRYSG